MTQSLDLATFQQRGLIRCAQFLPAAPVAEMRDAVLHHFEKKGLRRDGEWVARNRSPTANNDFTKRFRTAFNGDPRLIALTTGTILPAIETLLEGRPAEPMDSYPSLLFTLPNAQTWTVPHTAWHLDIPRLANPGIPGVQIFTFLERVIPGGGGTLVVTGSHHLLNQSGRLSSQALKKRLGKEPYFAALMDGATPNRRHFLDEPGTVGDVVVQVAELYGEPGDVYFMDLRLLHTVAPNATTTPRIMVTQRYLLPEARAALYKTASKS